MLKFEQMTTGQPVSFTGYHWAEPDNIDRLLQLYNQGRLKNNSRRYPGLFVSDGPEDWVSRGLPSKAIVSRVALENPFVIHDDKKGLEERISNPKFVGLIKRAGHDAIVSIPRGIVSTRQALLLYPNQQLINPRVYDRSMKEGKSMNRLLREYTKTLLEEQNILATGLCFPFSYQKADEWFDAHFTKGKPGRAGKRHPDLNDKSKFKVVHGTITDKWQSPPKAVVHGWVEMGDMVLDAQTQATRPNGIPKEFYYEEYQPVLYGEYTAEEAIVNCIKKGGEGPWPDELYDIVKKRDAWRNK